MTKRVSIRALGLAAAISLVLAALAATPAGALVSHPPIGSFGPDGTEASEFPSQERATPGGVFDLAGATPGGVFDLAFDQADGRLLALVSTYSPISGDEGQLCQFDASGGAPPDPVDFAALGEPCIGGLKLGDLFPYRPGQKIRARVAVDESGGPSTGNIYVTSTSFGCVCVYGFAEDGSPLGGNFPLKASAATFESPFSVGVDSEGSLWVGGQDVIGGGTILFKAWEFDAAGVPTGTSVDVQAHGQTSPFDIAFDSEDNLYVNYSDYDATATGAIWRYAVDLAGNYDPKDEVRSTLIDSGNVSAMSIDASEDHLFLARQSEAVEYDVSGPTPSPVGTFATGIAGSAFRGIALDQANDEAYLSDPGPGGASQIHAFAADAPYSSLGSFGPDGSAATKFPPCCKSLIPTANKQLAFDQAGDRLVALIRNPLGKKDNAEDKACLFQSASAAPWSPLDFPALGEPCVEGLELSARADEITVAVDNSATATAGNIYVTQRGAGEESEHPQGLHAFPPSGGPKELPGFPLVAGGASPFFFNPTGVAVDSEGHLWVSDVLESRIVEVEVGPGGPLKVGTLDTSSQGVPRFLAFDSRDNLYASFDTPGVNEPGPAPGVYKYSAASDYSAASLIDPGDGKDAITLALDRTLDRLFVLHPDDVAEYDVSGGAASLVSTFAGGIAGSRFVGVAVDEARRVIYVSDVRSSNNTGAGQIRVFATVTTEPEALTLAASGQSKTAATLNGSVNPKGFALSGCRFEYLSKAAFEANVAAAGNAFAGAASAPCAPPSASIPADESPHAVSASLSGLTPASAYVYRLVAESSQGTGAGKPAELRTDGPEVSGTAVASVTYTEASLSARINPHGSPTTYRFEYVGEETCEADLEAEGPGHCFDQATSTPESKSIGADEKEHPVGAALGGLAPGTAYRFRAIATDAEETQSVGAERAFATYRLPSPPDPTCPNAAHRAGPSETLPDCRAYEQVSPLDKGTADATDGSAQAAVSGGALAFAPQKNQAFPGGLGSAPINYHLARRSPDGSWSGEGLTTGLAPRVFSDLGFGYLGFAEDLSRGAFCTHASLGVPGDGDGVYLRESPGVVYQEVPGTSGGGQGTCGKLGANREDFLASPDYRQVFFEDSEQLTPDAPDLGGATLLYEWDGATLSIASREDCGKLKGTPKKQCEEKGGTPIRGAVFPYREGAVSTDGERVFWSSGVIGNDPGPTGGVYARTAGTTSVDISASERSLKDPAGPRAKSFLAASADGSTAYFASGEKLTDGSTATAIPTSFAPGGALKESGEIYRYDFEAPAGERLTDITVDVGNAAGAQVQGILGASEDGARIYFVALGVLSEEPNSEGAVADAGEPNLYLWEENGGSSSTSFIATLAKGSKVDRGALQPIHGSTQGLDTAMSDADGDRAIFLSVAPLSAYDNANRAMLYLYDAASEELRCLSCDPSGAAASANAALGAGPLAGSAMQGHEPRNLSADGKRVFFETADSLLPSDTNGAVDVYQWEEEGAGSCGAAAVAGGCLHLISSGKSDSAAHFADAGAEGSDVFFTTRERLSPRDTDSQYDVYDARVEGIAAEPFPLRPECLGEACQPAATIPTEPTPSSAGFRGAGNPAATATRRRCPNGKRKVRRAGKLRCVKPQRKQKKHRANRNRRASR